MSLCQVCRQALPSFPIPNDDRSLVTASLPDISDWSESFFDGQWILTAHFLLHASWESLKTSISNDCPLCWTIWRCIRSSPVASPNDETITNFNAQIFNLACEPNDAAYTLDIRLAGLGLKIKDLRLAVWKTTEKWYLDTEKIFPIADQHTPASVAKLAKRWINVCQEKHSNCLKQASPPDTAKMPTRLLDLGDINSDTWRIHERPKHVPYIALSHRWSHETPTLLTSNYHNYSDCQPDSILPQTYQDIVSICRHMGIRYLWIDSLCIIQDDGGFEFRQEAPLMMDIYQFAFLTLTICWGFPGLGVFRKCRPRSIPRHKPTVSYHRPDSVAQTDECVFVEHRDASDLQVDVDRAPLNNRAWVLQERCLSRRLLYLGNEQLYWECNGCTGSEVSPDLHCPAHRRADTGRQSMVDLTGPDRDTHWSWVLSKYTGYDLTFEQDRLIAISGLAKLIASKTGDSYLGGIWLESWMQDLLWEPATGPDSKQRVEDTSDSTTRRMPRPSWSWLAFPGSVMSGRMIRRGPKISLTAPNSYQSKELKPLALLSQTIVTPPESDHFASFDRAVLKIRGLLLPVKFTGTPPNTGQPCYFRHEHGVTLLAARLDYMQLRACNQQDGTYTPIRFCFSKTVVFSSKYFLLPLYQYHWARGFDDPGIKATLVYGLVVQEVLNKGSREFIRIGTWNEDFYSSQLSPVISNTIVKNGVGKVSILRDGNLTFTERTFDSRIGEYGVATSSSKVAFPRIFVDNLLMHGSNTEQVGDNTGSAGSKTYATVQCSLLPHFTTAEWATISLV
ncbi:hypothetical protein SNK05_007559 [Fusarium graminearum]